MHQRAQESTGYAFGTGDTSAQADQFIGAQRPTDACITSCNGPPRLRTRSDGPALPTITEQSSNLTLNTYYSLLGSRGLSSFDPVEGISSRSASLKGLRASDGHVSHQSSETTIQEPNQYAVVDPKKKQNENGTDVPTNDAIAILSPVLDQYSQPPGDPTDDAYLDIDGRNLRGSVRGATQNARTALRDGPRSSLAVYSSSMEHRESWLHTTQSQSQNRETNETGSDISDTLCRMRGFSLSVASSPRFEHQSINRNTSTADTEYSAHDAPSIFDFPAPPELKPKPDFKSENRLSRPVTPSRERYFSVRLAQLEPRDTVYKDGTAETRGQLEDIRDRDSARGTFYGASLSCNNAPSFIDNDGGRGPSPNTSFCGTISTSYSGTVLGVDLDLHRNFGSSIPYSDPLSPAATVWSELQLTEFEKPVSVFEPPDTAQSSMRQPPYRSITSSALTSLLPIATASGIVQPNYYTPKISFYSPSGNLIEPEGSVSSDANASDLYNPRTTLNPSLSDSIASNHHVLYATACLPPPRPSLVPMTTPPTSLAPLPAHLKHHHNHQKPERSEISPGKTFVMPGPVVMGCGGLVKVKSSIPQNAFQSTTFKESNPGSHSRSFRSTASKVRDLFSQAALYHTHLSAATTTSRTLSKITEKPHNQPTLGNSNNTYARAPLKPSLDMTASRRNSRLIRHTRDTNDMQDTGLRSALPGHALRICFCQPYDGAGKRTQSVTNEASCLSISSVLPAGKGEGLLLSSNDVADVDSAEHLVARTVDHVKERKKARNSMASNPTTRQRRPRGDIAVRNTREHSGAGFR